MLPTRSARPPTVLVVDPCPDTAGSLATLLTLAGFETRTAGHSRAAVQIAAAERPAVVITEAVLPDADGFALARQVADVPDYRPALVLVTGYPWLEERAQAAGFARHFVKPADPVELLSAVSELVDCGAAESVPA